jgi:hypothetical protein
VVVLEDPVVVSDDPEEFEPVLVPIEESTPFEELVPTVAPGVSPLLLVAVPLAVAGVGL